MKIDRSIRIASADNEKVWLDIKVQGDSIEFRTKGGSPVVLSDEDDVGAVIDALMEASSKAEHARRLSQSEVISLPSGPLFQGSIRTMPHLHDGLVGVSVHRVTDEGNVVEAPQIIAAAGEGLDIPEAVVSEDEAVIQKSAGDYEPLPEAAPAERDSEPVSQRAHGGIVRRGSGGKFAKKEA